MMNAATVSIAAALLFAWAASAAAQDRPAPAGSVVKFKNGSSSTGSSSERYGR